MHVNVIAVLQNKRDIRQRSLDFVGLFFLEHLSVLVTWYFLASIQTTVEDFTSNICYLISYIFIKFSVFVICRSFIF